MAIHIEMKGRTKWCATKVFAYDTIDSTNDEALRQINAGAGHGTLIISEEQTAGHGRNSRSWHSPAGDNIYMTLILCPKVPMESVSMITLVMGMAVAAGIEEYTGLSGEIKWPNDVIVSGRKVCGILTGMIEKEGRPCVYTGVGINVNGETFPAELADKATSLRLVLGRKIEAGDLAASILSHFERLYDLFEEAGNLRPLAEEYNRRLVNAGKRVRVLDPAGEYEGEALGIDETGELLVKRDGEVQRVLSGEVSVRAADGSYL